MNSACVDVAMFLRQLAADAERFRCVYADPPWRYGNSGTRGAAAKHYPTMTVQELCDLPVSRVVSGRAHLHLWTTNAFLFAAREVIEAWGFEYKSCYVWVKPQMGMGNYWRVSHEFLLLGVRGSLPFRVRNQKSWGEFPRGGHSEKPAAVRNAVMECSPGPYLEVFSRFRYLGWDSCGNQVEDTLFDLPNPGAAK